MGWKLNDASAGHRKAGGYRTNDVGLHDVNCMVLKRVIDPFIESCHARSAAMIH